MFVALLDTCVLWPSLQRDFLMSMAIEGLCRPLWSNAILEELHRHEQTKLIERGSVPTVALERANQLQTNMTDFFSDAIVMGWEALEGTYGLPDPDDEHVLAAAVVGGAGAIVTDNLKDFPASLVPGQIQVLSGREFAANTVDVDPDRALRAITTMSNRRRGQTPQEIVQLLVARYQMHEVDEILGPLLNPD